MRVLLIWWSIPEDCDVYLLEGEVAKIALEVSGRYIGGLHEAGQPALNKEIDAKLDQLSIALESLEPALSGHKSGVSLDLSQFADCALVLFSGYYM